MKTHRLSFNACATLLGAVFFLALALSPQSAEAQIRPVDARIVHSLNYNSGVLKTQWLPYGRRWAIQGTTLNPDSEIKAVVGEISARGSRDVRKSCWVVPPDVNTDVFRLVFEPLDIGRRYDLRMDFYGEFDVNVLEPALDQAYERTISSVRNTYPTVSKQEIREIFDTSIQQELEQVFNQDDVIFIRNLRDGDCEVYSEAQQVPPVFLADSLSRKIAEAVLIDVRAETRASRLEEIEIENRQLVGDDLFASTMETLRSKTQDPIYFHDSQDISALQTALGDSGIPDEEVVARLYASSKRCRDDNSFPNAQCDLLDEIVTNSYEYMREVTLQNGDYDPIKSSLLSELRNHFSQVYTQVANTRMNVLKWDDYQSTSDRIRIGTAVSFGAAALNFTPTQSNSFDLEDVESFGLVSLKFYPFAVDKKLPRPYFGREFMARTSLVAGILLKRRLNFQGQNLEGITGSIYPMFGVGFDITKNITLQAGTTFFRQPSVSVVDQSSEFKAAPVLSLGFDFDGVNWIRDRLRDMN